MRFFEIALPWILTNITFWKGYMMNLTIRKIIVLGLIGRLVLIGNILFVANWLSEKGVIDWAQNVRAEYL